MGWLIPSRPPAPPSSFPATDLSSARGAWWPGMFDAGSAEAAFYGAGNPTGVPVDIDSAMRNVAVWACCRVLISTICSMSLGQYSTRGNTVTPTNPQWKIVRSPSARVRRRGWVGQVMRSQLLAGNAYGDVVDVDALTGKPTQIETIHPGQVTWIPRGSGELVPHVQGKPRTLWPVGDFWHLPVSAFLMPGSPVALSPVEMSSVSIGIGLAAEMYGAKFFGDGAHPTAIAKSKVDLGEAGAQKIKDALYRIFRGGSREVLVLGADIELERYQSSPEESMLLDVLRFEVEQQCRVFGVPPQMVYAAISGSNVTYANATASDLSYLKHSVTYWTADLEDEWSSFLTGPQMVQFNTDDVLRLDIKGREEVFDIQLRNSTESVNNVRRARNQEPFPKTDAWDYESPGIPSKAPAPAPAEPAASPAEGTPDAQDA